MNPTVSRIVIPSNTVYLQRLTICARLGVSRPLPALLQNRNLFSRVPLPLGEGAAKRRVRVRKPDEYTLIRRSAPPSPRGRRTRPSFWFLVLDTLRNVEPLTLTHTHFLLSPATRKSNAQIFRNIGRRVATQHFVRYRERKTPIANHRPNTFGHITTLPARAICRADDVERTTATAGIKAP